MSLLRPWMYARLDHDTSAWHSATRVDLQIVVRCLSRSTLRPCSRTPLERGILTTETAQLTVESQGLVNGREHSRSSTYKIIRPMTLWGAFAGIRDGPSFQAACRCSFIDNRSASQ